MTFPPFAQVLREGNIPAANLQGQVSRIKSFIRMAPLHWLASSSVWFLEGGEPADSKPRRAPGMQPLPWLDGNWQHFHEFPYGIMP